MKPNLIEAGDMCLAYHETKNTTDVVRFALVIECADAEQVREAMRTGQVSFTVFGEERERPNTELIDALKCALEWVPEKASLMHDMGNSAITKAGGCAK